MPENESKYPNLKTQQERLRWARAQHFPSPRAAAKAFDWPESTYKSRENGIRSKRGLQLDDAKKYAKAFRVPLDWLMMTDAKNGSAKTLGSKIDIYQSEGPSHKSEITISAEGIRGSSFPPHTDDKLDSRELSDTHTVKVIGYVAAGKWSEMSGEGEVLDYVSVEHPEFAGIELGAHRIKGNSANRWFPDGWSVIYVPIPSPGINLRDVIQADDWVILRRPTVTGDFEITIKRLKVIGKNTFEFWPDSNDPNWTTPIIPPPRDELSQEGIDIAGVVVAYRPPRLIRSGRSAYQQ